MSEFKWYRKWKKGVWFYNRHWFDMGRSVIWMWEREFYGYEGGRMTTQNHEVYV